MIGGANALAGVLERQQLEDRQRAVRALLRQPLLTADHPAFPAVRRHAKRLTDWFARETGWRLQVDASVARLRKEPADPTDPTRPATDRRSGQPFSRRRYVLLCLALAALERGDRQTTLGRLADDVLTSSADAALSAAGIRFTLERRDERSDLVAVVRALTAMGLLARVAGDERSYVDQTGQRDALYDVDRSVLASLLATRRGPSLVDGELGPSATTSERVAATSETYRSDTEDARRLAVRQSLTRRLLDDPVVVLDDLDDAERAYWTSQRTALVNRVSAATGLVAEVRAEGVALLDPTGEATDLRLPEEGTDGHVTLLVAEHLAGRGEAGSTVQQLQAHVAGLASAAAYWRKDARAPGAEADLVAMALWRLRGLGLVAVDGDTVRPCPALARYRVAEAEVRGAQAEVRCAEQASLL